MGAKNVLLPTPFCSFALRTVHQNKIHNARGKKKGLPFTPHQKQERRKKRGLGSGGGHVAAAAAACARAAPRAAAGEGGVALGRKGAQGALTQALQPALEAGNVLIEAALQVHAQGAAAAGGGGARGRVAAAAAEGGLAGHAGSRCCIRGVEHGEEGVVLRLDGLQLLQA